MKHSCLLPDKKQDICHDVFCFWLSSANLGGQSGSHSMDIDKIIVHINFTPSLEESITSQSCGLWAETGLSWSHTVDEKCTVNCAKRDQLCMWASLCALVCLARQCLGVKQHTPAPTVSWFAVYTMSHLTLRWLQQWLNAHLTHSLPLWCNPVEVI